MNEPQIKETFRYHSPTPEAIVVHEDMREYPPLILKAFSCQNMADAFLRQQIEKIESESVVSCCQNQLSKCAGQPPCPTACPHSPPPSDLCKEHRCQAQCYHTFIGCVKHCDHKKGARGLFALADRGIAPGTECRSSS